AEGRRDGRPTVPPSGCSVFVLRRTPRLVVGQGRRGGGRRREFEVVAGVAGVPKVPWAVLVPVLVQSAQDLRVASHHDLRIPVLFRVGCGGAAGGVQLQVGRDRRPRVR